MGIEKMDEYLNGVADFVQEQHWVRVKYDNESRMTLHESTHYYEDEKMMRPMQLCDATIISLVLGIADNSYPKNEKAIQKMQLVIAYFKGIDVSTKLILEGDYVKAAATLKQDFEIMVRLNEITVDKAVEKKTPNAKHAPESYSSMYGFFNDIAHVAQPKLLHFILKHESALEGLTLAKRFNQPFSHLLMTYNCVIKNEILRQTVNLYYELKGIDDLHTRAELYYNVVVANFTEVGFFGTEETNASSLE